MLLVFRVEEHKDKISVVNKGHPKKQLSSLGDPEAFFLYRQYIFFLMTDHANRVNGSFKDSSIYVVSVARLCHVDMHSGVSNGDALFHSFQAKT